VYFLTPFVLEPLTRVLCLSPVRVYKLWLNTILSCSNFHSRLKIRLGKIHNFLVCLHTVTYKKCRDVEEKCHAFYTPAVDSGERSALYSGKDFVLFGQKASRLSEQFWSILSKEESHASAPETLPQNFQNFPTLL